MRNLILATLIAGGLFVGAGVGAAFAAEPNNQACLGKDVSGYAQTLTPWGQTVSSIAQSPNGAGDDVQAHLAGLVPDGVIPNSCND